MSEDGGEGWVEARPQWGEPTGTGNEGGWRGESAAGDGDSIRQADGGFMLPIVLSSYPGNSLSA